MGKFRELARKLVNVPREELRKKRELYESSNVARREQRKRKGAP